MSDTDSFINEVNEEVRRDQLFRLMRRWGWLAILVVVMAVGGAAYLEYTRAQERAQAEAFGDALLTALDNAEVDDRIAALEAIEPATVEAEMVLALLRAGEAARGGDPITAAEALRTAAETPDISRRYRDLALLRAEMLDPSEPSTARIVLDALAEPGAPYAALAQEQLALLALREGDTEGALDLFRQIEAGAASTPGLQQRAAQLIVAIEAGSALVDTAPVVEDAAEAADDSSEDADVVEDDAAEAAADPDATDDN